MASIRYLKSSSGQQLRVLSTILLIASPKYKVVPLVRVAYHGSVGHLRQVAYLKVQMDSQLSTKKCKDHFQLCSAEIAHVGKGGSLNNQGSLRASK
ncbi:hypothetical protein DPEC_G00069720 [Dallia pectoralis]|uniref:Uncharacterized protein n=1 Tax=Dallia pectoralis TaxID=75939 RepID=A0ACC2H2I8_DALPE|nr:hypothetical protein DPEC_G00069720 [Dallia pectoralis]